MNSMEKAQLAVNVIVDKKGFDIQMLDVAAITSIAEKFVICQAKNRSQSQAIADEIDRREIYFASDVLEREPMRENHPFLKVIRKDRLSLSPHIAWASVEARKTLMELVALNIRTFIKERK